MITRLLIDVLVTIPAWLLSVLPTVTFPAYLTGTGPGTLYATIQGAVSALYSVDYWLPVAQVALCAALVLAALLAGLTVKGVRIIASFLTLGGGSAA